MPEAELHHIPHAAIRYNPAINARGEAETDDAELKSQIASMGLGQPLLVRPLPLTPDTRHLAPEYEVAEGGRRWRVIGRMIAEGSWPAEQPVPCLVRDLSDAQALELSLMTTLSRLPLHPADEAAQFVRLEQTGSPAEAIAADFGLPIRRVRQRLAIGKLHPPILAALRAGQIDVQTAEAFTLAKDEKQQRKIWRGITGHRIDHWSVRRAITGEKLLATSPRGQFIAAAYRMLGGASISDLFGEDEWFTDTRKVDQAMDLAIGEARVRWNAQGWAWVEIDDTGKAENKMSQLTPKGEPELDEAQQRRAKELQDLITRHSAQARQADQRKDYAAAGAAEDDADAAQAELDKLTARHFTPRQMKLAGVLIINTPTDFRIREGLQKPGVRRQVSGPKDEDDAWDAAAPSPSPLAGEGRGEGSATQPEEPDFTGALKADLAAIMGGALQRKLADSWSQERSWAIVTASLIIRTIDAHASAPLSLAPKAYSGPSPDHDAVVTALADALEPFHAEDGRPKPLGETIALVDAMDVVKFHDLLALLIANTLDWGLAGDPALVRLLDPQITWRPDRAFFQRLKREHLRHALAEAAVQTAPSQAKPALVDLAVEHLIPPAWLPEPLRTPSYAGPGSNQWADRVSEVRCQAPSGTEPQQQAAE